MTVKLQSLFYRGATLHYHVASRSIQLLEAGGVIQESIPAGHLRLEGRKLKHRGVFCLWLHIA